MIYTIYLDNMHITSWEYLLKVKIEFLHQNQDYCSIFLYHNLCHFDHVQSCLKKNGKLCAKCAIFLSKEGIGVKIMHYPV